jgi:hypothetical protein
MLALLLTACSIAGKSMGLTQMFIGRFVGHHGYGLLPVIRPASYLLPIRYLIICNFYTIYAKSTHLNVNKNNCHFAEFIFGFHYFGILPDWLNNR